MDRQSLVQSRKEDEKEVEEVAEEEYADGVRRRGRTDLDCCSPSTIPGRDGKGSFDFDKSRRNDLQGLYYFARLTSLFQCNLRKAGGNWGEMNSQTGLAGSRHIRAISNRIVLGARCPDDNHP